MSECAPHSALSTQHSILTRYSVLHRWLWLCVPLLALIAYAPTLRIGFLSNDFVLLNIASAKGLDPSVILPGADWPFYRPVGVFFTWQLGWQLWGFNPLPYHVLGLALHALAALALALWLGEATARPMLGWLAGALFAVFPLNLEAVGWLAAQWDVWAAAFLLLSLWLYTKWWRARSTFVRTEGTGLRTEGEGSGPYSVLSPVPSVLTYAGSLLCYGLALFSKESILTFLPVFALSSWLVEPRFSRQSLLRLGRALLPFGGALLLNVALRLLFWGHLSSYTGDRTDYAAFAWDALTTYFRLLLVPINVTALPNEAAQLTGLFSAVALLGLLVWYGRKAGRLLLVAALWIALALLPVLNLSHAIHSDDLEGNRYLYLASAGYCVGVAALLYVAILYMRKWRAAAQVFVGVFLLLGVIVSWAQLLPWHAATVQAIELDQELRRIIPSEPRPQGMVWYIENLPDKYSGAYLFRLGLGNMRYFTAGSKDVPAIETVKTATKVDLTDEHRDAYALRFDYSNATSRFHVGYIAGITHGLTLPSSEIGDGLKVWDFGACNPSALADWAVTEGKSSCEPNEGIKMQSDNTALEMTGPPMNLDTDVSKVRFVRLRIAMSQAIANTSDSRVFKWFWKDAASDWDNSRSKQVQTENDASPYVYWTFLPASDVGAYLSRVRFDLDDGPASLQVYWIAIDSVK